MRYFLFFLLFYFQAPADSILDKLNGAKIDLEFSFDTPKKKVQFEGVKFSLVSEESTEARYSFKENRYEFCCERERLDESAHDMSEAESQRIVQNWLRPSKDSYKPQIQPAKGQR